MSGLRVKLLAGALLLAPVTGVAQQAVTNTAFATYQTPVGSDSVASNPVQTVVLQPQARLQKTVIGPTSARIGQTIQYRIVYGNGAGGAALVGVVVSDSLPAGFDFVSSQPAATVSGHLLSWNLGDIAPGDSGDVIITMAVAGTVTDTLRVRNRAFLASQSGTQSSALAPEVQLIGQPSHALALAKVADALDVGLGETAPYTLTLTNTGTLPLSDLRIVDRLPAGTALARGTASGADSVQAVGGTLTFYLAGPMAPGAVVRVRYAMAAVSASSDVLWNSAVATAEAGTVQSAEARAAIRLRAEDPMATRAAIGKVWLDLDGDGVQGPDDPGVPGVEIWTPDGEVATTDSFGRFSYRNLRAGQHGFRVNPASLPPGYQLADEGAGRDLAVRDASGWTTPRVDFRVVSRAARLTEVRLPAAWSFTAHAVAVPRPMAPAVAYEAAIENRNGVPLEGLTVTLPARPDSVVVLLDDSVINPEAGSVVVLPVIPPHGRLQLRAWGARPGDSASAALAQAARLLDRAQAAVSDSAAAIERPITARFVAESLPVPASLPAGSAVVAVLAPPATGWPGDAVWSLPTGWEPVPGTARQGADSLADPVIEGNGRSGTLLRWLGLGSRTDSLTVALRPSGQAAPVEVVSVPALRSPDAQALEQRRALVAGPGVEIFAPADRSVLRTDRLWVGVRGEANAPVTLFDGDSVLARANIRIDGVQDFIAVALTPGPHRLRVRMANSWGTERWDSIAVHVTNLPDHFAAPETAVQLVADGHSERVVRIRVLDRWGVPVVNGPFVTVSGTGAEPINRDEDPSSVGLQLRADAAGWIAVVLRPGTSVRSGRLTLVSDQAHGSVPLDLLPAVAPLFLTGVGRVGVGSAPGAFGALTARGRLDPRTSLTLSYDSRGLDEGREDFGRSYDPLEEAQYPILGDAGQNRSVGASRFQLAARVERGYDWLAFGDVSTLGFADGLQLSSYRRALPGASGHLTSGPVQWQAFFSSNRQSVQQLQLRGAGTSGPYELGADVAPGTEDVRLESRAPENAQRVISQQGLVRYIDYQIDYDLGTLLLKQPVPATDTYGNPVFIVVTYETKSGGPRRSTWGLRAVGDAGRLLALKLADSIRVGGTVIHDEAGVGARSLSGLDLRLRDHLGLGLSAELSHSTGADSSGFALSLNGTAELLKGALLLSSGWMRVDGGYRNPANLGILGGTGDFKLGGRYHLGAVDIKLQHEEQRFDLAQVRRSTTVGGLSRSFGPRLQLDALLTDDRGTTTGQRDASTAAEAKLSWTALPHLKVWAEGRHQFDQEGAGVRPDYAGAGAALQVGAGVSLEARLRQVFLPSGASYSVTDLGVKARVAPGTEAYSSYELAGVNGGQNAALIGLRNRLTLGQSWALNASIERRSGVGQAAISDPARALPFLQTEENYWSAALGAEYLPQQAPYRLSARGELRNGDTRSTRLLTVAGDVSLTPSLAFLSRQEFQKSDQRLATGPLASWQYNALWGVALRPVRSDRLNLLGKLQWIGARNPSGSVLLASQGDEDRLIAALEGIWSPTARSELALRYAARRTTTTLVASDSAPRRIASSAHFVGARARRDLTSTIGVRAEGRLLLERTSATTRWDVAPQAYWLPVPMLEVATGYHFGNLRDPDFAVDGGHGWFLTFGARLTEQTVASAAAFWRNRLGGQ